MAVAQQMLASFGGAGGAPPAGPSVIASGSNQNLSNVTVSGLNTTGATFLVIEAGWYNSTYNPSDSYGNTWVPLTRRITVGIYVGQMWYCIGATTGTGHNFTLTSAGGGACTMNVRAYGGSPVTAFQSENFNAVTAASTVTVGSITPSQANTLLVAGVTIGDNGTNPISIDTSYDTPTGMPWLGGTAIGAAMSSLVVTATAVKNPQWTVGATAVELIGYHAAFSY